MITLEKLRYFITAAESEHIGRAARKANISASVISTSIKSIEEELGLEVFLREKNRIKLNSEGHALLVKARKIIEDVDALSVDVRSEDAEIKGHFRLGASHFLMQQLLVPAFLDLQKKYPKLTVEFISVDSGVAISQVLAGSLDAALIFKSSYYHNIDEDIIFEDQFKIAVKDKHEILDCPPRGLVEELNKLPAITFRTGSGPNFWENHPSFKELNIRPHHTYFYEDTQTAIQLLIKTNGWAFLPRTIIQKYDKIKEISIRQQFKAPVNISFIQAKNKNHQIILKLREVILTKYFKY